MRDGGEKAIDAHQIVPEGRIEENGPGDGVPATWRAKPFAHWQGRLLTHEECSKVKEIVAACEDAHGMRLLVKYATSPHGLVDDQVRRIACMSPHHQLLQFEVILISVAKGRYCWDMMHPNRVSRHNPGASYHGTGTKIKLSLMLTDLSSTTQTVSSPRVLCMISHFVNVLQTNPTSSSTAEKRSSLM